MAVLGQSIFSYWRVQESPGQVAHNLAAGGKLDPRAYPDRQRKGIGLARRLLSRARIDLAGIDVLFSEEDKPLLLEINYTFGRRGLGGSEVYYRRLQAAVYDWMRSRGLRYTKKPANPGGEKGSPGLTGS